MDQNKNAGLIIALVVSILLVLGLGGYIVYDKVLSDNNPSENNNVNNGNNNNNNNNNGNNNQNNNADKYTYNDFVGVSYKGSDSEVNVTLTFNSDRTFSLVYAWNSAGVDNVTGTYILENDVLKLNPTQVQEVGEPVILESDSPYKNTTLVIIDKNTITLNPHYEAQFTLRK